MITHVVVFWTNKPSEQPSAQLIDAARRLLAEIPGVENFRAGKAMASERAMVDDSFAIAISMDFADDAALQAYQIHPAHKEFVVEYAKVLAPRYIVYDIVS